MENTKRIINLEIEITDTQWSKKLKNRHFLTKYVI